MRHVRWGLGLAIFAWTAPASAQLPPIGVPRGMVRFDLGGGFSSADSRYLHGVEQDYGADWSGTLGTTALPALAGAEAQIRQLTGNGSYRLSLGRSSVLATYQEGRTVLGLSFGLTNAITIFGDVPIVRVRTQEVLRHDSAGANAGFNPADPTFGTGAGQQAAVTFFGQFNAALTTLQDNIANGTYDADPAKKALAQQTLADGTALRDGLYGLISDPSTASPVLPIANSAEGLAILGRVTSLEATLSNSLGVSGFSTVPDLPAQRFDSANFDDLLTNPFGPVGGLLFDGLVRNRQGDAELGTTITLLDRWHDDGRPGLRIAATALMRLPTGIVPDPAVLFDRGTGDGQTDLEFHLATDLTAGRLGARISAMYNDQRPGTVERRVTAPWAPIAWASTTAAMRWDPGNVMSVSVEPFFRLADGFALTAGATYWHHGTDQYAYATPAAPGAPSADLLALDTDASATLLRGGVLFASTGARGGKGLPVEARWTYEMVASASGGRVDKTRHTAIEFRMYWKVFGR